MAVPQTPPPPVARVRMYRQGLGDCFLVTLPRPVGHPFQMLIDCGVVWGTASARDKLTRVARDVASETGGQLDVVVLTHEHWDHVSGLLEAHDIFGAMTIGEVWLPWTEDPADTTAARLRDERRQARRSLRVVLNLLTENNSGTARRIRDVLNLSGPPSHAWARDAIEALVGRHELERVRYLGTGDAPLELESTLR